MTAKADAVQQKSGGQEILWTDGALRRLENVPLPVRSFAKQMIETMAREQGKPKVDEILMDEAKTRFM
ncbi:MAG: PCP reductase family protein [Elusimicrobia bacterium]|nr:PCP reductase family protein [Elusimicrobiota bacterium]